MTVPEAPALERLADVAALERPAQAKRMLVIVNPYATTMSDRLKHLVVYALQGRYDVTAVDTQRKGHAIELVGEAAREGYDVVVAFGGDGTVNEAANGLAGHRHAADLPARRLQQRLRQDARDPQRRRGRHRAPARAVRPLGAARRSTSGASTAAPSRSPPAWASTRASSSASTPSPDMKRRFGALVLHREGRRHVPAQATWSSRRSSRRPSTAASRSTASASSSRTASRTRTSRSGPINLTEGARLDSGDLAGVVLTRANPVDVPTVLVRALSTAPMPDHRRVEAFEGAQRGRHPLRATGGRCRGRSTATTSPTTTRCASRSSRARSRSSPERPAPASAGTSRLDNWPTLADVGGWPGE